LEVNLRKFSGRRTQVTFLDDNIIIQIAENWRKMRLIMNPISSQYFAYNMQLWVISDKSKIQRNTLEMGKRESYIRVSVNKVILSR
jgi:hypothetical protein